MRKYVKAEKAELVFSGENFFSRLEAMIRSARERIHLQTYILEEDETGSRICALLSEAAARGVRVYVLADAFGSKGLHSSFIERLNASGVNFRLFSPFFSSESIYYGRRLHHKIAVADRRLALVGGINIANKYRGAGGEPPWLDYAVWVEGKVCAWLDDLCGRIYEKKNFVLQEPEEELAEGEGSGISLRFRRNDWVWKLNEIHKSYRGFLLTSQSSLNIVASYFLPGYFFRKSLKKARKREVEIHLILAGRSDLPLVRLAEKYLYRFLLRNGIRIYEWKNSVMHGKAVVVDEQLVSIGSYNLNHLSHYRSIELNVDIRDRSFAALFSDHLSRIKKEDCTEIKAEEFLKAETLWSRLKSRLAYDYMRLLMKLFLPRGKNYQAG